MSHILIPILLNNAIFIGSKNEFSMIWKNQTTLKEMNARRPGCMLEHLNIEFIELGKDFIRAKMPVDMRTIQPLGILHGGASVTLAETLGSFASLIMTEDINKQMPVGVSINANHLNSVRSGHVYGTVRPVKVGRKLHIWQIAIEDDLGRQVCTSRLTVMMVERR